MAPLQGLLDALGRARHRAPSPVFCPVCGSHRMKPVETYGILPCNYRCEDCGYQGLMTLELEPCEEEPR